MDKNYASDYRPMKREEKKTKSKTGDTGINIGLWGEIKTICFKRGITPIPGGRASL
jgi:hypothetical protein